MKYCIHCGNKVIEEANFCSSCGNTCEKVKELENNEISITEEKNEEALIEKQYDIVNKIKSSKWNAFLLKEKEYRDYLEDGVTVGLLLRFSKTYKENNIRMQKRNLELLNNRVSETNYDHFKYNTYIPDITIEDTLELSKLVYNISKKGGENNSTSAKLQKFIDEAKKMSGDVVACYPVSVVYSTIGFERGEGVLIITTKGISFVSINKDSGSLQNLPYAVVSSLGPYGAIAVGVGAMAAKFIVNSAENYRFSKEQQKIIAFAKTCSPCLFGCLFAGDGQFIPYDMINALIYDSESKKETGYITCIYRNICFRVIFEMKKEVLLKIVEKLSGDNPPIN